METHKTGSEMETKGHTPWIIDALDFDLNNPDEGVAIIDDCGIIQARACDMETAKQIITAVNAHAELVEALKQTLDALYNQTYGGIDTPWISETKLKAKEALKKAGVTA